MRIQIVMGFALPVPALKGGAVEKRWHGLAIQLARRHQVTLFSCRHPALSNDQYEDQLHHVRLRGLSWSNRPWLNAGKSALWSYRVARDLGPGDVLITSDVVAPILIPRMRANVGVVCVDVNRMPKFQHRWAYGNVDRFYCSSSAVMETMARRAPAAYDRSRLLHNSTDPNVFSPPATRSQEPARLELLYTGRVHPEKGIDTLLRAIALSSQRSRLFLRVVGPAQVSSGGDPNYANYLRQLAGDLGLTPADWCLDPPVFSDAGLAEIYRRAAIFAYPSRAVAGETFGIAVLEAMACGKPCVVSPLACFRDLVTDDANGLIVKTWEPADWAVAIDRLATDPDLRRTMGERSRQLALNFTPAQSAARLEDDLEHLLAQRQRDGR